MLYLFLAHSDHVFGRHAPIHDPKHLLHTLLDIAEQACTAWEQTAVSQALENPQGGLGVAAGLGPVAGPAG